MTQPEQWEPSEAEAGLIAEEAPKMCGGGCYECLTTAIRAVAPMIAARALREAGATIDRWLQEPPPLVPEEVGNLISKDRCLDDSRAARAALESALQRLKGPTEPSEEVRRLRLALERIAYEPQGHAEASHTHVLTAVECIAKEALAIDYPGLRPHHEEGAHEVARLLEVIEEMRSHEATPDDAPPQWNDSEAAAWYEGFSEAMDLVHRAAYSGLLAVIASPTPEEGT